MRPLKVFSLVLIAWIAATNLISDAWAARQMHSITDRSLQIPTVEQLTRVLTLQDYNTRVVTIGVTLLGLAAGVIAPFLLLRKRSLVSDTLSHGSLPGICLAFVIMVAAGGSGKSLPGLLAGAVVTALISMGWLMLISSWTRLKQDTAMGIVLSVTFGFGIALLGIIQKMATGSAAGLETFVYGKTASMIASDAKMIAAVAAIVIVVTVLLFKEFTALCFDQGFARSQGWPVFLLDTLLMALCIAATVIGLQAVGLILMVAFLIIPAAAARFWTDNLRRLVIISALIGAFSGWLGAAVSALMPRMPAGAVIVLICGFIFMLSMFFGQTRGIMHRALEHLRTVQKVAHQHLLRAMYENLEGRGFMQDGSISLDVLDEAVDIEDLLDKRSWTMQKLQNIIHRAVKKASVRALLSEGKIFFTKQGLEEGRRVVRNHRLWEMYLIAHASVAAGQVDHEADRIEHILSSELVEELEDLLEKRSSRIPASAHKIS